MFAARWSASHHPPPRRSTVSQVLRSWPLLSEAGKPPSVASSALLSQPSSLARANGMSCAASYCSPVCAAPSSLPPCETAPRALAFATLTSASPARCARCSLTHLSAQPRPLRLLLQSYGEKGSGHFRSSDKARPLALPPCAAHLPPLQLRPGDAAVVAAIVIVFGLGIPLLCYFRRGWRVPALPPHSLSHPPKRMAQRARPRAAARRARSAAGEGECRFCRSRGLRRGLGPRQGGRAGPLRRRRARAAAKPAARGGTHPAKRAADLWGRSGRLRACAAGCAAAAAQKDRGVLRRQGAGRGGAHGDGGRGAV